jgi:hypothetical protein
MSKEFKVVIAEDGNETVTISVSSTGWNDFELAGIQARLLDYVKDALVEQNAVKAEEETKCYCGHTTVCQCGPNEDVSDEE